MAVMVGLASLRNFGLRHLQEVQNSRAWVIAPGAFFYGRPRTCRTTRGAGKAEGLRPRQKDVVPVIGDEPFRFPSHRADNAIDVALREMCYLNLTSSAFP